MDFYKSDNNHAWLRRFIDEWRKIEYFLKKRGIKLTTPCFEITDHNWGEYTNKFGGNPTIRLSRRLFESFEWGSVVHVLKHEVAHYIVDVFWNMGDMRVHGESFKKACALLEIDPRRTSSIKELLNDGSSFLERERIVVKIKKIMALTSSTSESEANNALRKAEELMLKHNIEFLDTNINDDYLFRPIGPLMKRVPNYVRDLADLVSKFYFVQNILCYCGTEGRYYEFFGTKENLDIADYIFSCLLNQSEVLWKEHSTKKRKEHGKLRGVASKTSFIEGLISGYYSKLRVQLKDRESVNSAVSSSEALIWSGDPLLAEMYNKTYPNIRHYNYYQNFGGHGYNDGFKKGNSLSLNAGLNSGKSVGNIGRLLT